MMKIKKQLNISLNKVYLLPKVVRGRRGFVLLFAVTLAAILLSIALGVSQVALKEITFGTSARNANDSFFAADTGTECALFYDRSDQNKFSGGNTSINCAGATGIPVTLVSTNVWSFSVLNLGSASKSCAFVSIDKNTTPGKTYIVSKGYNVYTGSCVPINNVSVERELDVNY